MRTPPRDLRTRANPFQDFGAVKPRKHEVEDNQRKFTGESTLQPGNSIMNGYNEESLASQILRQKIAQINVIVDDEYPLRGF